MPIERDSVSGESTVFINPEYSFFNAHIVNPAPSASPAPRGSSIHELEFLAFLSHPIPDGTILSPHFIAFRDHKVTPDFTKRCIRNIPDFVVAWDGKLYVKGSAARWHSYAIPLEAVFVLGDYVELVDVSMGTSESIGIGDFARIVAYYGDAGNFYYILESEAETGFLALPRDLKKSPEGFSFDEEEEDISSMLHNSPYESSIRTYLKLRRNFKRNMVNEIHDLYDEIYQRNNKNANDNATIERLKKWTNEKSVKGKDVTAKALEIYPIVDGLYHTIHIHPGGIQAVTKILLCHFHDAKINFGNIGVNIHYRKAPTFFDVDKKELTASEEMIGSIKSGSWFHPHIKDIGDACFGEFDDVINDALRERDYIGLLRIVHQYLISPAPGDSFVDVMNWVTNKDEICHKCYEKDCRHMTGEAEECPLCGNDMDDCECWHCGQSGDNMDAMSRSERRSYCSECDSYNSDNESCEY